MGTSVSRAILAHVRNAIAALLAALLAFTLLPAAALAADGEELEPSTSEAVGPSPEDEVATDTVGAAYVAAPSDGGAEGAATNSGFLLASTLVADGTHVISADVALDGDPVIGSFTVDGLTFALSEDGVTLVSVSQQVMASQDASGSDVGPELAPGEGDEVMVAIPSVVTYGGATYSVTAIGPYAFYLSGATSVALPETISSVDDRAFRSSDVARIEVAEDNPNYASFDGALYSADLKSLLLIPEGRAGAILLSKEAEVVQASKFSHCSLVDAGSVEEGGAAFASWEGLLYDASGETLLRVPAGATDITIREGCTTIAAGAMEGCAKLKRINAPASVTSISPDVFTQETQTVALPASSLMELGNESREESESTAKQLTAVVALTATDDPAPKTDPAAITALLPGDASTAPWQRAGLKVEGGTKDAPAQPLAAAIHSEDVVLQSEDPASGEGEGDEEGEPELPAASLGTAETYAGAYDITITNAAGSTLYQTNSSGTTSTKIESNVISCGDSSHHVRVRFLDKNGSLIVQMWHSATSDNSYYRWVKPGYVLVGVKVTNGAGTITDEIRASEVGTSYPGASKIKGAGRTISPIFEKVAYNVTLDNNGATTAGTTSVSVAYNQAMPAITVPTKAGSRFLGYFSTASSTGGTQYYDEFGKSAHVWDKYEECPTSLSTTVTYTIYARWLSGVYDATYVPGSKVASTTIQYGNRPESGGTTTYYARSNITSGITITGTDLWHSSGSKISLFRGVYDGKLGSALITATPKDGYSITEWWWGNTNTKVPKGQSNFFKANTQFGPIVTANKYNVSFNANGGSGGQSKAVTATYDAAMPAISTDKPVRAGYVFEGWYDTSASSGGTQYYTAACASARTWNQTKAATLFARWADDPSLPVFDANGGAIHYKGGGVYKDGKQIPSSDDKWGANVKSFSLQGGSIVANRVNSSGGSYTNEYVAMRVGYSCLGWSESKDATSGNVTSVLPTSGSTYYAIWKGNDIGITWNAQGGRFIHQNYPTETATKKVTYGDGKTLADAGIPSSFQIVPAGMRFCGWGKEPTSSKGQLVSQATRLPTENTTYYAQWAPDGPMVNFKASARMWRSWNLDSGSVGAFGDVGTSWTGGAYIYELELRDGYVHEEGVHATSICRGRFDVAFNANSTGVESAWLVTGGVPRAITQGNGSPRRQPLLPGRLQPQSTSMAMVP